ncbi:unnamed protein product, partial [Urochloa humidicola]
TINLPSKILRNGKLLWVHFLSFPASLFTNSRRFHTVHRTIGVVYNSCQSLHGKAAHSISSSTKVQTCTAPRAGRSTAAIDQLVGTVTAARQMGQAGDLASHRSTQAAWNACRQDGMARHRSPARAASRHTAHAVEEAALPSPSQEEGKAKQGRRRRRAQRGSATAEGKGQATGRGSGCRDGGGRPGRRRRGRGGAARRPRRRGGRWRSPPPSPPPARRRTRSARLRPAAAEGCRRRRRRAAGAWRRPCHVEGDPPARPRPRRGRRRRARVRRLVRAGPLG